MNIDCIKKTLKDNLTEKRYIHTLGVVDTAVKLADIYGEDPLKAQLAALCHDSYKCISVEENNKLVEFYNLDDKYLNNKNLAHSKIAALKLSEDFNIFDEDVKNAIEFHTTGRVGMSMLEKIIYIADAIEPNREYFGLDKLRELAYKDIDKACMLSLSNTVNYLVKNSQRVDEETILALKYLKERNINMNNKEYAMLAAEVLDSKKAEDIDVIDISTKSSFADYFVIASGTSERQVKSLVDDVEDKFAEHDLFPKTIEGKNGTGWILMDFGDIIVNVFTKEMREKYSLEKIWGDCDFIDLEDKEN